VTTQQAYNLGFQAAVICGFADRPFHTDDKTLFLAWVDGYNFGLWVRQDMPSLMVH
jgi:hypothetical protein